MEFLGDGAVFDAGFGAAGGMVVDEDKGGGVLRYGGSEDFARVDGGFAKGLATLGHLPVILFGQVLLQMPRKNRGIFRCRRCLRKDLPRR